MLRKTIEYTIVGLGVSMFLVWFVLIFYTQQVDAVVQTMRNIFIVPE